MIAFLASQGLPVGSMIDGWQVLGSLGSGGFGAVQKVEKNGRLRALKIALLPEGTPDEKKTHARTLRELLCLLLLDHPNIVRVVAHGRWPDESGGHLYLVLEYVEGWTLAQWIERTHPTALEIIRVFVKIAAAVAYMHARGVFHRDLKLSNVLIRKSDGEPVIIDFGAADFAQAPDLTDAGLPPGTERYRAPEANRWWYSNKKKSKARYDFRVTDELFAFGVMLYDALTDPRPSEDRQRSAVNSILVAPRDPQSRNPRIPDALASQVRRLLAKDPAKRPENFEAVCRELAELLEHQGAEYRVPVHSPSAQMSEPSEGSPRPPPSEDSSAKGRWSSRKRLVVGGSVGAAALAAVAASTWSRGFGELSSEAAQQAVVSQPPASVPAETPATETDPSPTVTASSQKESNVKTLKSAPTPQKPPKFANEAERLKWCKAIGLGTVLAVNAGCLGTQVRPEPGDCPADAVKAMKKHGLQNGHAVRFTLGGDVKKGGLSPPLKSGKVEGAVVERRGDTTGFAPTANLPPGTRLFGELWTAPDKERLEWGSDEAALRFYRAQLPNGPEFPVCIVSGDTGEIAVFERPEPGAIRVGSAPNGRVVYRWR